MPTTCGTAPAAWMLFSSLFVDPCTMATDGLRLGYLDKYRLMGGKGVIFPDSYRSGYGSGAHHGEPGPGPWGVQLAKPLRERRRMGRVGGDLISITTKRQQEVASVEASILK